MGPFAWLTVESLREYRKAKRRLQLNLSDPMVCNRYLLFGLTSMVWIVVEFVAIAQVIELELTQGMAAPLDVLLMATELVSVVMVWLVFFSPAVYRRWLQRAAPATLFGEV